MKNAETSEIPSARLENVDDVPDDGSRCAPRKDWAWTGRLLRTLWMAVLLAGSATLSDGTHYQERNIHGWSIAIEARLAQNPSLVAPMIKKLEAQLSQVVAKVPSPQIDRLRETPIWLVETDSYMEAQDSLGLYHFSAGWLAENGYPPELHQAIQFDQRFGREHGPSIVFHELAHAYHDRELGLENPRIMDLYEQAKTKAAGARDRCPREGGVYAFSNVEEFFATFSQAYFGGNCSYPNNRNVIRLFHPEMLYYLNEVWAF